MIDLDEFVTGDENVIGKSRNILLDPRKPASVGLWFYELAGMINNTAHFKIYNLTFIITQKHK